MSVIIPVSASYSTLAAVVPVSVIVTTVSGAVPVSAMVSQSDVFPVTAIVSY